MDDELKKLEQEYDNWIFLAEGLIYDHQLDTKLALLRKADYIKYKINELKKLR
jgi:hypothetical protein